MKFFLFVILMFSPLVLFSQEDLLDLIDTLNTPQSEYTYATFKSTRIISSHSIETMKEGQLEFRVAHRFGRLNSGVDNFWGLDQSTTCLSLEYGLTDDIEIGFSRTPNEKTINGFTKLKILSQKSGASSFPLSIGYMGSIGVNSSKWNYPDRTDYFSSRLHFVNQLLFAKKINEDLSLQLSPTHVHYNLVKTALDDNNVFACGLGARYKLNSRISFNIEYFYVIRPEWNIKDNYKNPLSIGFDIETGGHVFQLMLSNSQGMIEKHYITDNTDSWSDGGIHFGFNISRVFTLY